MKRIQFFASMILTVIMMSAVEHNAITIGLLFLGIFGAWQAVRGKSDEEVMELVGANYLNRVFNTNIFNCTEE